MYLPWDPAVLTSPHPPNLDHPLLVPPESPFFDAAGASKDFEAGEVGMGGPGGGGVHLDKPLPVGHEATETRFAYAPVSQAHGHNHIVQCHACCTAA